VIHTEPTVFIVDSDALARNAVHDLVCRMDLRCRTYSSGLQFLREYDRSMPGCLVCEIRVLDISGLDVQRRLAAERAPLPVVFLTAHATVAIVVRALCEGAVDFLEKPFREDNLWEAVQNAVRLDQSRREALREKDQITHRLRGLTRGESAVWQLWACGQSIPSIAERLKISTRTVETRQIRILRKLGIQTSLDLLPVAVDAVGDRRDVAKPHGQLAGRASIDRERGVVRLQSLQETGYPEIP